MFDPFWPWGLAITVLLFLAPKLINRWMGVSLGVRNPSGAMLERTQAVLKGLQRADELVRANEFGTAMLLLDDLGARPELEEIPALGAQVEFHRARIAHVLGRADVAVPSARKALEFYRAVYAQQRNGRNSAALGEMMNQVGEIQLQQEDFAAALDTFTEVKRVNKRGAFVQTVVRVELSLARAHLALDNDALAADHAREALRLARRHRVPMMAAEALYWEAVAVSALGDLAGCRRLLDEADGLLAPDSPLYLRVQLLSARFALERIEGAVAAELGVGFELLRAICDMKVGRGWRQHQADVMSQTAEVEQRVLELSAALALAGDERANATYTATLQMLRESDIAHVLRAGLANEEEQAGLPAVISKLLADLAVLEDPEAPTRAPALDVYERLEVAASARFRQLVAAPSIRRQLSVPVAHHVVMVRLVQDEEDRTVVYGSWIRPGEDPEPYRHVLTQAQASTLREVIGAGDPPRTSAKNWHKTLQCRALSDAAGWTELGPRVLPPGFGDHFARVSPDSDVPLVLFSPDSGLWSLPWSALSITADTALIDHAAVALVPSCSLFGQYPGAAEGRGVLSYLSGVDESGLGVERSALGYAWPDAVTEAGGPDALVDALARGDEYEVLALSVHGDGRAGLAHSLILDPRRSVRLSAGRMIGLRFPATVVVGACFSGSLDRRVGTDPTGIPSVMPCQGATTVIGGLFPLPDGAASGHSTAGILGHLYVRLAEGEPAPWALRSAQRRWRSGRMTSPLAWASLTAMSNGAL
ncbi:CHAT domain-containing protein [Streptomyces sp. ID05-26A]|nr:CHAT domain-containing protein [Streptomyces sp. ID05-26A]